MDSYKEKDDSCWDGRIFEKLVVAELIDIVTSKEFVETSKKATELSSVLLIYKDSLKSLLQSIKDNKETFTEHRYEIIFHAIFSIVHHFLLIDKCVYRESPIDPQVFEKVFLTQAVDLVKQFEKQLKNLKNEL